jgi:hypothetical protein
MSLEYITKAGESAFEILLWLGIFIAWMIIQAMRSTSKDQSANHPKTEQKNTGSNNINDVMDKMFVRTKQQESAIQSSKLEINALSNKKTTKQESKSAEKQTSIKVPIIKQPAEKNLTRQFRSTKSLLSGGIPTREPGNPELPKIAFADMHESVNSGNHVSSPLIKNIKSPQTLKRVILYHEIIGKPKGMSESHTIGNNY